MPKLFRSCDDVREQFSADISILLRRLSAIEKINLSRVFNTSSDSLEAYFREDVRNLENDLSYEEKLKCFADYRLGSRLVLCVAPLLIFIGTVGNAFSFVILRRRAMLKLSTYLYLLVLAVADTLVLYVGLANVWVTEVIGMNPRDLTDWSCKLITFLGYTISDYSVWLIVAVTVERYIVVCHPLRAPMLCNHRTARRVIVAMLAALLTINAHFLWTVSIVDFHYNGNASVVKRCDGPDDPDGGKGYVLLINNIWPWVDMVLYALLPFLILASLNTAIIRQVSAARRHRRRLGGVPSTTVFRRGGAAYRRASPQSSSFWMMRSSHRCFEQDSAHAPVTDRNAFEMNLRRHWRPHTTAGRPLVAVASTSSKSGSTSSKSGDSTSPITSSITHRPLTTTKRRDESGSRLTFMLLAISFTYLLTVLPVNIVTIASAFLNWRKDLELQASYKLARFITDLLMYVNHSINFFLYCATGQKFRRELSKTLKSVNRCVTKSKGCGRFSPMNMSPIANVTLAHDSSLYKDVYKFMPAANVALV